MKDKRNLDEANKEIERSKVILQDTEDKKNQNEQEKEGGEKEEGSGIFTADGKELPNIDGGYDIVNPGSNFNENDIVSV